MTVNLAVTHKYELCADGCDFLTKRTGGMNYGLRVTFGIWYVHGLDFAA